MTVGEAIRQAKALRPSAMNEESGMYYRWLTEVDQEVAEALNRHVSPDWEPGAAPAFDPLDMGSTQDNGDLMDWFEPPEYSEADADTDLILPKRWEMIYVYKLMCEIDLTVGETEKYNQDAAMYNQMMAEYKAWLRRTMTPKQDHRRGWKLV